MTDQDHRIRITLRLPEELYEKVRRIAFDQKQSLNAVIIKMAEDHITRQN